MVWQFHSWYIPQRIESMDSNQYLYTHVHSSIIYNSQKEATQVFINKSMDKQKYGIHIQLEYHLTLRSNEILIRVSPAFQKFTLHHFAFTKDLH